MKFTLSILVTALALSACGPNPQTQVVQPAPVVMQQQPVYAQPGYAQQPTVIVQQQPQYDASGQLITGLAVGAIIGSSMNRGYGYNNGYNGGGVTHTTVNNTTVVNHTSTTSAPVIAAPRPSVAPAPVAAPRPSYAAPAARVSYGSSTASSYRGKR
jgi:hypothetical protein